LNFLGGKKKNMAKMLLLEVCCLKHVLAWLVPGHVCGFTILQHPVLQWPLLHVLLYHVWVPLGKQ
jgi:hypothetical protein